MDTSTGYTRVHKAISNRNSNGRKYLYFGLGAVFLVTLAFYNRDAAGTSYPPPASSPRALAFPRQHVPLDHTDDGRFTAPIEEVAKVEEVAATTLTPGDTRRLSCTWRVKEGVTR